ncbi:MAG: Rpp14/Pop5 family protein [Methanoregula sp.]|jgi:ribonuclease P/MRP protein subunit POP5|nr:Rpp14/Pop5 family protein [Methanoregula sp.]
MSTRPPTLREKRRYLLVTIDPLGTVINQKELYYTISDATTQLWGDVVAAVIMPAVVASEGQFVIIRCRRGTEHELATALSTITSCRDTRIALRMVAASGTIDSLRDRMRRVKIDPEVISLRDCTFDKKVFQISQCHGQKVDVIEKGFKNTNRLFLTKEDLEEL